MMALVIWGLFYDFRFILVYVGLLLAYQLLHMWRGRGKKQSLREKLALALWGNTGNPTILARIEIDCEKVDDFLAKYNAQNPDSKLSYTIIGVKSLGNMSKDGTFSKCLKLGNIVKIPPKVTVLVDVEGSNLA